MDALKDPQINAAIRQVVGELSPIVKYMRYEIRPDWAGDTALYLRVMLSSDVTLDQLRELAPRVRSRTEDLLDIATLGLLPHFNFRTESEQATLREVSWEPLPQ